MGELLIYQVKSNIDYNVTVAENSRLGLNQLFLNDTRGLSTSFYSFAITPSEEYDKREGEIIITSGESDETVKVYQTGSAILILSQNEYTFGCDGGRASIDISSNFEYEIDMPNVDWIQSANLSRAVSSHTLVYEISANNTYADREAVIVFKDANGNKKESVSIKQIRRMLYCFQTTRLKSPKMVEHFLLMLIVMLSTLLKFLLHATAGLVGLTLQLMFIVDYQKQHLHFL